MNITAGQSCDTYYIINAWLILGRIGLGSFSWPSCLWTSEFDWNKNLVFETIIYSSFRQGMLQKIYNAKITSFYAVRPDLFRPKSTNFFGPTVYKNMKILKTKFWRFKLSSVYAESRAKFWFLVWFLVDQGFSSKLKPI